MTVIEMLRRVHCNRCDCKFNCNGCYYDQAINALEKQIPKKPIEHIVNKFGFPYYECPVCGECDVYGQKYCDECGQKLDWSEDDE